MYALTVALLVGIGFDIVAGRYLHASFAGYDDSSRWMITVMPDDYKYESMYKL